jgi:hypothetical protein
MNFAPLAGFAGVAGITLALAAAPALAHPVNAPTKADGLARAFQGKICTTKGGAKFMFGADGLYSYDGLWTNAGRYSVRGDVITVTLDNGLERDFAVSRKDGVLYVERSAVSCHDLTRP